jgi:predicted RNA-binding protein
MCEATAYLLRDGQIETVMEGVDILESEDNLLRLTNLYGEEKKLKAKIKGFSLVDHKILLEPL